jgi:ATP-dependent helicase HrpB
VVKVTEVQRSGIVDRPDANSKIRTKRSVRYIRIHALAPSNRPVQVTENLALFWRETYPKLKQQLAAQVFEARLR